METAQAVSYAVGCACDNRRGSFAMNPLTRITLDPDVMGGKPCIRGLRITVYDVLSYLAAGTSIPELLDEFPYLTKDDVFACLSYAADRE